MGKIFAMNESFSIQFTGKAFDNYEIPASALAQSLLALDSLSQRAAEVVYGKDSGTEIKVRAGFRKGSFIIDLVAMCEKDPIAAATIGAGVVTVGGGVVQVIKSIIRLAKFSMGKKVEIDPSQANGERVSITNENGEVNYFETKVVNIYNQDRTLIQLSRLTQTLGKLFKNPISERWGKQI